MEKPLITLDFHHFHFFILPPCVPLPPSNYFTGLWHLLLPSIISTFSPFHLLPSSGGADKQQIFVWQRQGSGRCESTRPSQDGHRPQQQNRTLCLKLFGCCFHTTDIHRSVFKRLLLPLPGKDYLYNIYIFCFFVSYFLFQSSRPNSTSYKSRSLTPLSFNLWIFPNNAKKKNKGLFDLNLQFRNFQSFHERDMNTGLTRWWRCVRQEQPSPDSGALRLSWFEKIMVHHTAPG